MAKALRATPSPRGAGGNALEEVDGVQPPVGDGAAADHRQALRPGPAADAALDAVPDDARPQLGEVVGRVAAGEHVEGGLKGPVAQVGEGVGAPHQRPRVIDQPAVQRAHRHQLLGQHVERVARHPGLLDLAGQHPLHHHRRLQQVAPVLGEHDALGRLADGVAGAADPLDAAGNAPRRLHLDDQVDRAHVDAQLQARGRHQRRQASGLERLLDLDPLLAGDRAVVGAHQLRGRPPSGS